MVRNEDLELRMHERVEAGAKTAGELWNEVVNKVLEASGGSATLDNRGNLMPVDSGAILSPEMRNLLAALEKRAQEIVKEHGGPIS